MAGAPEDKQPKRAGRNADKSAEASSRELEERTAQNFDEEHEWTMYERRQTDYVREATMKNVWYYRDRMSVPRGPCTLPVLRDCWVHGVVDQDTLIWGHGLADFIPIRNVNTLVPQIRTVEVQVATWLKKHIALKPALKEIQKHRANLRKPHDQLEWMF